MPAPVYNSRGQQVGWLEKTTVRNLAGRHIGFIHENHVLTYQSKHVGFFKNGYFLDKGGHALAFIPGAQSGPPTPVVGPATIPPAFTIAPPPPRPLYLPIPPLPSFAWSQIQWDQFLT